MGATVVFPDMSQIDPNEPVYLLNRQRLIFLMALVGHRRLSEQACRDRCSLQSILL